MSDASREYPLITIGVSAYNREDYLPLCLDSLINQTYPNCEIIVVDDGSTDGTAELMRTRYPQVKYVWQENGGDGSAKNHVARIGKGEYIVFNDSDDLFLPDAVERLYKALDSDSPDACSYGTYQTINAEGEEIPTKRKMKIYPSGKITGDLLRHIIINSCGTLMPRKFFLECGGFDTSLRVCHDWALFLEMSTRCSFFAIQEPVFQRRRHGSNISSAAYAKEKIVLDVFEKFLALHPEYLTEYPDIIMERRSDFQRKLCREAMREKLYSAAAGHASEAWKINKNLKNFIRLLQTAFMSKVVAQKTS